MIHSPPFFQYSQLPRSRDSGFQIGRFIFFFILIQKIINVEQSVIFWFLCFFLFSCFFIFAPKWSPKW